MNIRGLALGLAVVALTAGACAGTGEPERAAAQSEPARDGLSVPEALQRQWGIRIEPPARTSAAGVIVLAGTMRFDDARTVRVTSLLDGQVVSLTADLGTHVRPGQVLATIHAPEIAQAKTTFLQAAARAQLAAREYERARTLLEHEAIEQKEALRRKAESDNASSEFGAAESSLHSFGFDQAAVEALLRRAREAGSGAPHEGLTAPYLEITSPIEGRVIERNLLRGQHVEPDQMLFVVSDLSTLWAVLDAREADLRGLSAGQVVRIRTNVYPERTWSGRITHIGDTVDERSRTVKVRVETRNDGLLLKPNMFVQGEVADQQRASRDVLTIPDEAVQTINGDTVVFVRATSGRFEARPVEVGERLDARRVVARGLDGTESVVVSGAFNLKAELLKSSLAGEQ